MRRCAMTDLELSSADARLDESVRAQIALDVSGDDLASDALTGLKPLAGGC